jgi:hypothetical protein
MSQIVFFDETLPNRHKKESTSFVERIQLKFEKKFEKISSLFKTVSTVF